VKGVQDRAPFRIGGAGDPEVQIMARWRERLAVIAIFAVFILLGILVWALLFFRGTL